MSTSSETDGAPSAAGRGIRRLTVLCLAALAAGVLAGMAAQQWPLPGTEAAAFVAEALIRGWTNAFRVLVLPLVVSQILLAVLGTRRVGALAGRLGATVPVVFVALLALVASFTLITTSALLQLPWFADFHLPDAAALPQATGAGQAAGHWIDGFIPTNLFAAASTDNILPVMLVAMAFGFALRGADDDVVETTTRLLRGTSHVAFVLIGWLMRVAPPVMFALGYRSARTSGAAVGEVILGVAAVEILMVLLLLVVLYLIATLIGGHGLARYARALWPAQLAAVATRSSLATLPALLKGAETTLGMQPAVSAMVLPFAGATLKLSRAMSGPVKLLFLGHVLGIPISVEKLVIFAATMILLSASTVGVPRVASSNRALPAYVAAGIPAEYVVMLSVVVSLTDIFLTLLNTSGYMAAAVLAERFGGRAVVREARDDTASPIPPPAVAP